MRTTVSWAGTHPSSPLRSPTSQASLPGSSRSTSGAAPGPSPPSSSRGWGRRRCRRSTPRASFVAAARQRLPGVTVERAAAEELPFGDDAFDVALAQLVVHFMEDPVAGLREMARVTRAGRRRAACVWDHGGGRGPLSVFWSAARELDPAVVDESTLAGAREGQLAELLGRPGCARSKRTPFPSASSIGPSMTGGSPTRSASARPAATSPVWIRIVRPSCANAAGRCCRHRRSC